MSRKRAKRGPRVADAAEEKLAAGLPNELLLEIWDYLPPIERVAVSQVCSKWRGLSLSTPRLWSRVAFVSTRHADPRSCMSCRSTIRSFRKGNIYMPRHGTTNARFFEQVLLRSTGLPLDVTILLESEWSGCERLCFQLLANHINRLARLHVAKPPRAGFSRMVHKCRALPALRTLTAGFDDRVIEYVDLPIRRCQDPMFPVLNQVHIGGDVDNSFSFLRGNPLPSVQELTLSPVLVDTVRDELHMCPNLARLNLVMALLSTRGGPSQIAARFQKLAHLVADVHDVCFLDIPTALDAHILRSFNDARHRHLILDYQGRHRVAGSLSHLSLPSPCEALAGAVSFTLRLRESVYELDVSDAHGRRREILLDASTILMAPGLWDCYLREKTIVSAAVDALTWNYFVSGRPEACDPSDLTIVVARAADELQRVSLTGFVALRKLRVESPRTGLRLNAKALGCLVASRAEKGTKLDVLSIGASLQVEDFTSLARHRLARSILCE